MKDEAQGHNQHQRKQIEGLLEGLSDSEHELLLSFLNGRNQPQQHGRPSAPESAVEPVNAWTNILIEESKRQSRQLVEMYAEKEHAYQEMFRKQHGWLNQWSQMNRLPVPPSEPDAVGDNQEENDLMKFIRHEIRLAVKAQMKSLIDKVEAIISRTGV